MFSRPIRWVLALHGDAVIPFTFAGLLRSVSAPASMIHIDHLFFLSILNSIWRIIGDSQLNGISALVEIIIWFLEGFPRYGERSWSI